MKRRLGRACLLPTAILLMTTLPAPAATGDLLTLAGGFTGDGGPATGAVLRSPNGIAVDASGALYVADRTDRRVRKVVPSGTVSTVVGNGGRGAPAGRGDGGAATAASLVSPQDVTVDPAGNVYVSDVDSSGVRGRIRKVDTTGKISTFAGGGISPDLYGIMPLEVGPATALVIRPSGLTVDPSGNLYLSDTLYHRVRKVDALTGIATIVASIGHYTPNGSYAGDGGPAAAAKLAYPQGLAWYGNALYIADLLNHRIRKVDLSTPEMPIVTFAGTGVQCGVVEEGALATETNLCYPSGLSVDGAGDIYLTEALGYAVPGSRVRKIDAATGTITTVAGTGFSGFSGDGGPATSAQISSVVDVAAYPDGGFVISDTGNKRIRRVDAVGVIQSIAGAGTAVGDGGPATQAGLAFPRGMEAAPDGSLYIADTTNRRVRKVSPSGVITTVAGNGLCPVSGDGGPATDAAICGVTHVTLDGAGNLYIASTTRIRKVDVATGIISTIAGNGYYPFQAQQPLGEGEPATSVAIYAYGMALDTDGTIYYVDGVRDRVRRIDPSGNIWTVAGTGPYAYNGDNIPATTANIHPQDVELFAGALYIADGFNNRVRRVELQGPSAGIITTVAGGGQCQASCADTTLPRGDGGPATTAWMAFTEGIAFDGAGNLYIAETSAYKVRRVGAGADGIVDGDGDEIITTIAGTGREGFAGDDPVPATQAMLDSPTDVVVMPDGRIVIVDHDNNRIRAISL